MPEVFLACFGDETIEFSITGDLYCEGGGGIIPAWFITDCEIAGDATAGRGTLRLVMNPATGKEVGRGGSGTWALIGHFGDPAAEACVADGFLADRTTSDELVHLCRTTFVLDTPPTKL